MALFGRRVRITVGIPGGGAGRVWDSTGAKLGPPALPAPPGTRGLRMSFDADKSLRSSLNQATAKLWNLSPESRGAIRDNASAFLVEAGYGDDFGEVFRGYVTQARTVREGPDLVTTIESADGYDAAQTAELKASFARGTSRAKMLVTIAEAFGLPIEASEVLLQAELVLRGYSPVLLRPVNVEGKVADTLERLRATYRYAFDWSIQHGAVLLVGANSPVAGLEVKLFSTALRNIIGQPSPMQFTRAAKIVDSDLANSDRTGKKDGEKVETKDGVAFKTLLDADLRPGGLVALKSAAVTGAFRLERVQHSGDSDSGAFESACEGRTLPGVEAS